MGNPPYRIDQTITEILKEFVHKNNLPTEEEIYQLMLKIEPTKVRWNYRECSIAIRKLMEGKK